MRSRARPGFALVTVLWVLALAGGITLAATLNGRLAVDAARHRIARTRSVWQARGCLASVRAALTGALRAAPAGFERDLVWRAVQRALTAPLQTGAVVPDACTVAAEPIGVRLDVNTTDAAALHGLLFALGRGDSAAMLVDALEDWRDADDLQRPDGAETAWYRDRARPFPANAPFGASEEVRRVRGFEAADDVIRHLDVERGRVALLHAPPAVLASLPGFTNEAVQYVVWRRRGARPVTNLHDLLADAPVRVRERVLLSFAKLSEVAAIEPEAWLIAARVEDGGTGFAVTVQQVMRRTLADVHVTRERAW